jgi:hypothetical protein
VSLHSQYYEKFRMLWFSAEKQPSIFIKFFNSIGTFPPLKNQFLGSVFSKGDTEHRIVWGRVRHTTDANKIMKGGRDRLILK